MVAGRLARYNGLEAEPLYHPPPLHDRLHPRPVRRLRVLRARASSANKRPDLLVGAARRTSSPDTRVALAGTGTMRRRAASTWPATAGGRLDLLGFVDDDDLVERFAGALGVVYAPFDEDYGYVTLQAFLAGKPVITTTDAGGVLEWVEDGVTGFVCDPEPTPIADAIDRLARRTGRRRRHGRGRQGTGGRPRLGRASSARLLAAAGR